jgi:nucleoside phosphorylase
LAVIAGVVVFVPLQEEMEYIYRYMESNGGRVEREYDSSVPTYNISWPLQNRTTIDICFHVIEGMGNMRTVLQIAPTLIALKPHMVFLTGLAGSLDPDYVSLGDVVVSTQAKMLYPDKIKEVNQKKEQFLPRDETTPSGVVCLDQRKKYLSQSFFRYRRDAIQWKPSIPFMDNYISYLRRANPLLLKSVDSDTVANLPAGLSNISPKVRSAVVFASDFVVDSGEYIAFLRDRNGDEENDYYVQKTGVRSHSRRKWINSSLSVVDMESFGFFCTIEKVCNAITTQAFSVRGISDLASEKEKLDEGTEDRVRGIAVQNALNVVLDMVNFIGPYAFGV